MSTLRIATRLLARSAPFGLTLALGFGLAGCTNSPGLRTGGASRMKTLLSVGDKPSTVVSGAPGSKVAADDDPSTGILRRNRRTDARISGRVVDRDGNPVPAARVRLADGGASGGAVVSATTDRSGAFTLHGLRPATDYTVVAEWEDDGRTVTGRTNARAADTDVRISLGGADSPAPARAAGPSRIDRVSDREPVEDDRDAGEEPGAVRPAGRVNEEDLPPAAPAETVGRADARRRPDTDGPTSRSVLTSRPVPAASWGSPRRASAPAVASAAPETPPDPERPASEPAEPTSPPGEGPEDDVPNPLPPALERGTDRAGSTAIDPAATERDPFATEAPQVAASDPFVEPSTPALNTRPIPNASRRSSESLAFASPSRPTPSALPTEPTVEAAPGAIVVEPETFAPVVDRDADRLPTPGATASSFAADPFVTPEPAPRVATVAAPEPTPQPPPTAPARRANPATTPKRRPTWGEVVASTKEVPPLESAPATAKTDPGVTRRSLATEPPEPAAASAAPVVASADAGPRPPFCDYDDRHRQIVDFCLPDLDGKPVRFQGIDADLVLIDFWGTWCQPCIRSIPHLVDLQQRMGKKLVILGVACEPDETNVSSARVAATAAKLHVNYPILVSRNDGSCPLQEALHVQAFPTMVLVDRQGRVLWRDQGATPSTLARLDRFLASAPTPEPRVVR